MSRQRRTTIIVVGGALAIASVGYGLGTQANDGTAVADNAAEQDGGTQDRSGGAPPLGFERGAPPGFADLADRLGVDANALARALREFHDQHDADRRDEFTSDLARALGISTERVRSAFDRLDKGRHDGFFDRDAHVARGEDRFAKSLAAALGANVDDVKAALGKLRGEGPVPFGEFASKLADELGLDVSDVRAALIKLRPPFDGRMRHRADMPLRHLARALGVSRGELRTAFRELRRSAENGWEEHQKELAQFLADRFNLDAGKVSDALAAVAPPLSSPHPPRPPDHPRAF